MTTEIQVKCCAECPFFVQTMGSMIGAWLFKKGDAKVIAGECDHTDRSGRRHFPLGEPGEGPDRERERRDRRLRVIDANELPTACPLRTSPLLVTVGS